jgi:ribosomal protein S18 acetylase RimI-like enzyme
MTLHYATSAELSSLAVEAVRRDVVASADALEAFAAAAPWRVQVSAAGDAVVFDRWREHLDWLSMRAVWAAPGRVPELVRAARTVARERGFGHVMSPLVPAELARPYERAGMVVATRLVMLRRELPYADAMELPPPPPEGIRVAEGTAETIDEILALDRACFEPVWAYDRELLESYLRTDRLVEARGTDGALAGFTLSRVEGEQGSLGRLAVARRFRRRGLGSMLVEEAVRSLRSQGIGVVSLTTQVENAPARALYATCGFREVRGTLVALVIGAG